MKTFNCFCSSIFLVLLAIGCNTSNSEKDKNDIIFALKGETEAFSNKDYDQWASFWKQDPDILFTYVSNNQTATLIGFENLAPQIKETMASMEKNKTPLFSRDYITVQVDGDLAWAHFTQKDTLDGTPSEKHESRTLQRVNDKWKISASNMINTTSLDGNRYSLNSNEAIGKTHINLKEFPIDQVINHVKGWGGMA